MAAWKDFVADEPAMARLVLAAFGVRKHCTIATLRADGAPRISGSEVTFGDDVLLGMMPDSRKAVDLRRDPRVAVHSPTVDPEAPDRWVGEAKFSGRAELTAGPGQAGEQGPEADWFRVELSSVVFTGLTDDATMLRIQLWRPGRGREVMTRA